MKDNKYIEMIVFLYSFLKYINFSNKQLYFVYNWLTDVDPQEGNANGIWELQQCLIPDDSIFPYISRGLWMPLYNLSSMDHH